MLTLLLISSCGLVVFTDSYSAAEFYKYSVFPPPSQISWCLLSICILASLFLISLTLNYVLGTCRRVEDTCIEQPDFLPKAQDTLNLSLHF